MPRPVNASKDAPHVGVVVITRPAGTGSALARKVRRLGGTPLLLPGLALRAAIDPVAARSDLQRALADPLLIFSSPAAVRYAAALLPLRTTATVFALGHATARALRRHDIAARVPARQDSEGLLADPQLQQLHGCRVGLIGAPGGRGLLRSQLLARGAIPHEVYVYRRLPARLDRRHLDALRQLPPSARVLLSSAESLENLCRQLPPSALGRLLAATAVVSSERLARAAREAGFRQVRQAPSALSADLLDAAMRAG